jgi:hypothetical protein
MSIIRGIAAGVESQAGLAVPDARNAPGDAAVRPPPEVARDHRFVACDDDTQRLISVNRASRRTIGPPWPSDRLSRPRIGCRYGAD